MEKEKLEGLLIEYIDGDLSVNDKTAVEKILAENKDAVQLYNELKEVMGAMGNSRELELEPGHEKVFERNLKMEIVAPSKVIFMRPVVYRAAAAIALILLGLGAGYWINRNNQHENELAVLRKEMAETKQMMMAMLTNDQSASQRMQGVNVARMIPRADDEVVSALAHAMMTDVSTNVRLAALEALSKFINDANVRKILITSLSRQDDPMVQIALIQLLVNIKEKEVVNGLEKIIEDDKSIKAVKDEAYSGILKLS